MVSSEDLLAVAKGCTSEGERSRGLMAVAKVVEVETMAELTREHNQQMALREQAPHNFPGGGGIAN